MSPPGAGSARLVAGLIAALALAGCDARAAKDAAAEATPARWEAMRVTASPVTVNAPRFEGEAANPRLLSAWALSSPDTTRLGGLSSLALPEPGRFWAVSDEGDFLEFAVTRGADGAVTGFGEGRIRPILGLDGGRFPDKASGDAESLAILPDGRLLIGFEQVHRIQLHASPEAAPTLAPTPSFRAPANRGLEALTAWPEAGADAYVAGTERGQVFLCRLSAGCERTADLGLDWITGLTAMARDPRPGGGLFLLIRSFDPVRGFRVRLERAEGPRAKRRERVLDLAAPAVAENFEGLAVEPAPGGGVIVHLLSDDDFKGGDRRTLLLTFKAR